MEYKAIDAQLMANMFLCGAKAIENQKEIINELNVFPVPDGDTGTNMTLTILSAVEEIEALPRMNMHDLCKAISSGSLRGARGNSGVILSQLLRGFTKTVRDMDTIDIPTMAAAFQKAQETAYKAVMKPKEGTILTVAREIAEKAALLVGTTTDFYEFFQEVLEAGRISLENTPELLPVLKEAGVVDSGGRGLLEFLGGAYEGFCGKEVSFGEEKEEEQEEDISLYSTEFVILPNDDYNEEAAAVLKDYLASIGEHIVFVPEGDTLKIHVDTDEPGVAIQKALEYGSLLRASLDNRKERFFSVKSEKETPKAEKEEKKQEPAKPIGFVAVSAGEGLEAIFRELGVDEVISGGQTMNPSTEDILRAVGQVNAEHVFIFPNNKNIILAANQAKDLTTDKDVVVIPTTTVPQGISAVISFMPESDAAENEETMKEAITGVRTGQITYAIRDTQIDGRQIHEGDYMGIGDAGILANGADEAEVMKKMLAEIVDEDAALITMYYGEDTSEEEATALASEIEALYPDCEVECHCGGQPVYYYLVSVE